MRNLKKSLLSLIVLICLSILIVSYTSIGDNAGECIQSFEAFAYFGPTYWSQRQPARFSRWQLEDTIPSGSANIPVEYPNFALEASRMTNEQAEIWLRGAEEEGLIWLIYRPASKTWESISRKIDNTNLISDRLFVTDDGTLWSSVRWSTTDVSEFKTVPILVKFNEDARRFIFEENVMSSFFMPGIIDYGALSVWPWPIVILDRQNTFWVFVQYDGLYSYNPNTRITEKRVDITKFPVEYAALAPDGTLYFSKPADRAGSTGAVFGLHTGMLFQFNPAFNEMATIDVPPEWPGFSSMLVDKQGILRLGATSYRMPDGIWGLMHPDLKSYFNHAGDHTWAPPRLIFESSDDRLWYTRYLDGSGGGTAWYDPKTGKGGVFYGNASTVLEDSYGQLWIIANSNLYVLPLN